MADLAEMPRKSNVLVVDDEPRVCQSVQKILNRRGYEVTQSLCVSAALEFLESGQEFDLVIADLMMPQVGGMELLKIMRDRWPSTPVLIITGYASITSAVDATKRGAVGYLPKPFTPDELERAVMEALCDPSEAADAPATEASTADPIDVDMPFDRKEVAQATSAAFVDHLTRSDVPLIDARTRTVPDFCAKGDRSCKRVVKQGVCKQPECPLTVAERKKKAVAAGPRVAEPAGLRLHPVLPAGRRHRHAAAVSCGVDLNPPGSLGQDLSLVRKDVGPDHPVGIPNPHHRSGPGAT